MNPSDPYPRARAAALVELNDAWGRLDNVLVATGQPPEVVSAMRAVVADHEFRRMVAEIYVNDWVLETQPPPDDVPTMTGA